MKKRSIIELNSDKSFNDSTREKVIEYLHKSEISLNSFSKLCGVGQPNLHTFINGKTLAIHNLEKIWRFFNNESES